MKPFFAPASSVILRHAEQFINCDVLFSGSIQDLLPCNFIANSVSVHLTEFDCYRRMKDKIKGKIDFSVVPNASFFCGINALIYFWPKSKQEAQFQLSYLLHYLSGGTDIFIVGENRTGVRSCERWLLPFADIKKVDSARRCSLYYFKSKAPISFDLNYWWRHYQLTDGSVVYALPGVFAANHVDEGSALLIKALTQNNSLVKGNVLDIGCGVGVLSIALAKINPHIRLTLTDTHIAALTSSQRTLKANNIEGTVIASDVFSNIRGKFDLIVCNPPFHDGLETDYIMIKKLIFDARNYLTPTGGLCLVANSFLPYGQYLAQAFGQHTLLLHTSKFKVYLAL